MSTEAGPTFSHADLTTLTREQGFALAGVADASPIERADVLARWLAEGRHGEMTYLAEHADVRVDPGKLLPGARAVLCVADRYAGLATSGRAEAPGVGRNQSGESLADGTPSRSDEANRPRGRIARYAWGRDYHKSMKKRLHRLADRLRERFPEHAFRCCVDTAPLHEREYAARAGIGWTAKHTLLIHPELGSWLLLGAIVTTLPLRTSRQANFPDSLVAPTDRCGTCTRCIDACPTDCIEPYQLDASRCISYLTIEHRSEIAAELQPRMGRWIAGCDICQEVCPHNEKAARRDLQEPAAARASSRSDRPSERRGERASTHPDYTPASPLSDLDLLEVLEWTEVDRRRVFQGSALKRINLEMLKRNALIALGNALTEASSVGARGGEAGGVSSSGPAGASADRLGWREAARDKLRRFASAGTSESSPILRRTARQVLARVESEAG